MPSSTAVATGPDIAAVAAGSPAAKSPPQVVQDSQQKRFAEPPTAQAKQQVPDEDEGDFGDELDLDLDQLDLNEDEVRY